MKIYVVCSKAFYDRLEDVEKVLKKAGHEVVVPVNKDNPTEESRFRDTREHAKYKAEIYARNEKIIKSVDAILVLNYSRGAKTNYIGGTTFLLMYEAFMHKKAIYVLNPLSESMVKDEIIGFNPSILNGNLKKIK